MRTSYILGQLITLACFLVLSSVGFGQQNQPTKTPLGVLQGIVSVSSGSSERLPGASLTLTPANPSQKPRAAVTNDQGEYKFTDLAEGSYSLKVELAGFASHTVNVVVHAVTTLESIALDVADISATVTVTTDGDQLNTSDTTQGASFKQEKLQTVPLASERFQDALPLVPGVVRGPDGLLNIKGARASQSGVTVNSANVTDPVTGSVTLALLTVIPLWLARAPFTLSNPSGPLTTPGTSGNES